MAPFPPEDGLELVERHAGIEFAILRDFLVGLEGLRSIAAWLSGGSVPVTGFHSTIESPDSVSRVAPPTSTMMAISAAIDSSHHLHGAAMRGLVCGNSGH